MDAITKFDRAELDLYEAIDLEVALYEQLVALDVVIGKVDQYNDPRFENATLRGASKTIAQIDHPEMDEIQGDLEIVYQDLEKRYIEATESTRKATVTVMKEDQSDERRNSDGESGA